MTQQAISHVLVRTRSGRQVPVRPLGWGERHAVQTVFDAMSAESRRLRFLTSMPRLPGAMLRRLTEVDHDRHGAWVAEVSGEPVAIARYVRFVERPDVADIAVSVVDEWQGGGLGSRLLEVLGVAAGAVGVTTFAWTMDAGNERILRLAAGYGGSRQAADGVVEAWTAPPTGDGVDADAVRYLASVARLGTGLASAA